MTQGGTVYLSLAAYYAGTAELTSHAPPPRPRPAAGVAEAVRGVGGLSAAYTSAHVPTPLGRVQPMHAGPVRGWFVGGRG